MTQYAYYNYIRDWPQLVAATNVLEEKLRLQGRPVAANMLLKAWGELRDANLAMAKECAALATAELRKSEKATRVRPDTEGDGGPRLEDALEANPMPNQDMLPGSVGVANMDALNASVPWWITNEVGSSARIGHPIFGYFFGDGDYAPPSADEFRVHPLFEAGPGPVSGGGVIENPIPARRFIEKAIPAIDAKWQAAFRASDAAFGARLAEVLVTFR